MTATDARTTDAVLFQLKSLGEAQADTVATRLGITVQGVRQRLDRLLAGGMVAYADKILGRGRPRRMWSLTPQAASLFPDTHAQLTVDLISTIRSELGERAFSRVLQRRANEIAGAYRKKLGGETGMPAKLAALAKIRSGEGYMARLEELPSDGYLLIEDHCPICAAAMVCQAFCTIELEIFKTLFDKGWQIEREDHLLLGARRGIMGDREWDEIKNATRDRSRPNW